MGIDYCWSEFIDAISGGVKSLAADQRKLALDFAEKSIFNKQGPVNINFMADSLFARLRTLIWLKKSEIKARADGDVIGAALKKYAAWKLISRSWWKYITRNFFTYDIFEQKQEHYVYFPLFFRNEMSTLASYNYWAQNPISLVEEVAESLPVGIKLYVKEHPQVPGDYSFKWLKKVRDIPNVKVIHPLIKGQDLINNCEAVLVLSGTSGWEAYLSKKPVVMLDPLIFFSRSRLVYKVGSPAELPVTLFNAIKTGSQIYDKNEEEWLWFIYSVISSCGKGTIYGEREEVIRYISQKIRRSIS
jgi:hypothetical protein